MPPGSDFGARLRPGMYYCAGISLGTTAFAVNVLAATPFFVPRAVTLDRIGLHVATASGSAGSQGRLGIYADIDDQYGGYPASLVSGSTGQVATDATGFVAATISAALNPGLYWLAFVPQTAGISTYYVGGPPIGHGAASTAAFRSGYQQSSVTGALPSTFTSTVNAQTGAALQVRVT